MGPLAQLVDIVLHFGRYFDSIVATYGTWFYLIAFLVIFCETGLVVTPFLPGDSLLFLAGAVSARGGLDVWTLFLLLTFAAIAGDNVNYWAGRTLGPKVLRREGSRIFKKAYLDKTRSYFQKYGGKTIVIARFAPIVRTFAPFLAGVGSMRYSRYLPLDVFGGVAWIGLFVFGGFFFGNVTWVREHVEVVALGVIAVSLAPAAIEYVRHRLAAGRAEDMER